MVISARNPSSESFSRKEVCSPKKGPRVKQTQCRPERAPLNQLQEYQQEVPPQVEMPSVDRYISAKDAWISSIQTVAGPEFILVFS